MHALPEFGFHLRQLGLQSLPHRVPQYREPSVPPLAADVREAEEVEGLRSALPVLAPSLVYAPGDRWLTALGRFAALLPAMPVPGRGRALFQPIWAEDVADCIIAVLRGDPALSHNGRHVRYELAGPQALSHDEIVRTVQAIAPGFGATNATLVPVFARMSSID